MNKCHLAVWLSVALSVASGAIAGDKGGGGGARKGGSSGIVTATPTTKIDQFKATIAEIDIDAKTLKLKSLDGSEGHPVVVKDTTPILKGGKRIKLSDLKVGDKVTIKVEQKDGSAIAHSVTVESSGKSETTDKKDDSKTTTKKEDAK